MNTKELYELTLQYANNPKIPTRLLNHAYDNYIKSAYKDTLGGVQNSEYALPENMFQVLQAVDGFKDADLDSVINNRKTLKKLFKELNLDTDNQQAALRYFKRHNANLNSANPQLNPQQEYEQQVIQQVEQAVNAQRQNNQVSQNSSKDLNDNIIDPNPKQPVVQQNTQQNVNNLQQQPSADLQNLTNNLQQQNAQQPSPQNILHHINLKRIKKPTSYNTLNTTDFGKINLNNVNPVDTSVHHFYAKNNAQNNFDFESKGSRDDNPQHQQQIPLQDLAQGVKKAATNNGPEKVEAEIVTPGQEYGTNNNNANNTFNGQQRFAWWSQNPQQNDPTGNNTVYGTAAASAPPGGPPGGPGDLTGMFNRLKQGNLAGQYAPQINTMAAIGQGVGALSNISKLSQGASNLDDLRGQILNSYSAANAPYYNLDPSQMSKIRRLQRGYTDADKPGLGDAVSNIGSSLPSILMQAGAGFMSGGVPGAIINGIGGAVNAGLEGVNKKQQQKAAELESLYGSLMQANASINNRRMMQQPYIY